MKRFSRTVLVVVATMIVVVVAGVRFSSGTSPCRPSTPVRLTATLVEVRQDDMAVPSDDPIFSVLPRVLCVAPLSGTPDDRSVDVSDCYDPQFRAVFLMETP